MPSEFSLGMIDSARNGNAVKFKEILNQKMSQMVSSSLEDRKTEIAKTMFKTVSEQDAKERQHEILKGKRIEQEYDEKKLSKKNSFSPHEEEE
jgi:hypothetical protein